MIVGGGPAGLACAIRLTQLLAEDEALLESLGEVPVALVEKGKGPGSHLLSGAMMNPSAMQKLFPDLPEEDWPTYGTGATRTRVYLLPNRKRAIPLQADAAAVPQPRQPRDVGRPARAAGWPRRPRTRASTSSARPPAHKLLVEDGRVVGVRSGDKGRGRDGEELSNFEPGSDLIAKATVLCRGHPGPPDRRGDPPLRARLRGPAAVGARREGGLGGREAARPRDPHDGLAAPLRRQVPRVRRLVHLPDGRGQGLDGPGRRARLPRRALLGPRRAAGAQGATRWSRRSSRAASAWRWGAKTIPSGGYWAMPEAAVGAGHGALRRRRRDGATSRSSRASTTPCTPACSRPRRSSSGSRRAARATTSPNYEEKVEGSEIETDIYRSRNMRQPFAKGFLVGGAIANMMEISGGRFPGGRWATHDDATVDVFIGKERELPEARRQDHLRQAVLGLRHGQRHPRRRAQPHPHPGEGAARGGADVAEHVPGAGLRGARGGAGGSRRTATASSTPSRRSSCTSRRRTACSAGPSPPRAGA